MLLSVSKAQLAFLEVARRSKLCFKWILEDLPACKTLGLWRQKVSTGETKNTKQAPRCRTRIEYKCDKKKGGQDSTKSSALGEIRCVSWRKHFRSYRVG